MSIFIGGGGTILLCLSSVVLGQFSEGQFTGLEVFQTSELPSPKIVIIGAPATGKSSLANSLLGVDPDNENALFKVCDSLDSCTKETSYGTGLWLGQGQSFTVVDTPGGYGDSDGDVGLLMKNMTHFLKNVLKEADVIVLLLDGSEPRFNTGFQDMLKKYSAIFGDQWWDHVIIGVSFWKFDEYSIKQRKKKCPGRKCKDEAWFINEIQSQLETMFYLNKTFDFAFLHSYSQTSENLNDPVQQKHWKIETDKLWSFATSRNKTMEFKDVFDILQENRIQKREISRLNGIIDQKITQLTEKVGNLNSAPVGTISAWVFQPVRGDQSVIPIQLPKGWVRCNGDVIPGPSVWVGKHTPNLNGEKRFLRGGRDSDMLSMEDDQMQDHKHSVFDQYPGWSTNSGNQYQMEVEWGAVSYASGTTRTTSGVTLSSRKGSENRPKNMNIIWIMRVF